MRTSCLLLFLFGIMAGMPAEAQRKVTDLSQLVALVLQRNPRLQAERLETRALDRRAEAGGVLPSPGLAFELRNVGWDRLTVGDEMMSGFGISVTQNVPFPPKLKLHSRSAELEASQQAQMTEETRLALVREAKQLYAQIFYSQRSCELLRKKKSLLEKGLSLAQTRYALGQGLQADLFKAQVEISQTEGMLLEVEEVLGSLQARVAYLLAFEPDSVEVVAAELPVSSLQLTISDLQARALMANPRLRGAELEKERAAVAERLARAGFLPDFMVRAGTMFRGRFPDMYEVMIGLELPLYWNREKNLLAEARLRQEGAQLRALDLQNEIIRAVRESFVAAKSAEARVALYRERTIPQAERSLQATLSGYQVGRVDFLSLLSDIHSLITYEIEYARSLADLWIAAAQLEELTGFEILPLDR